MTEEWEQVFKQDEAPDPEFPESYDIVDEIKSPLNVLWYNLRFEFPDKYPAKMPEDFARDMIKLYSKPNETVWDPMCGSGIVPRTAIQLNRNGFGTDVNPKAIDLAQTHDSYNQSNYLIGDARTAKPTIRPNLILFSPPFGLNIIGDKNRYSDEPKDISHSESYKKFFIEMNKIFQNCFEHLQPGGKLIFDARDRTKDKTYYDLGVIFRNMAESIGFKILCRYWYVLIPYRQMTYKYSSGDIMPMVAAMDAYVMYKPEDDTLG